jgi:predicted metal-dependent phosphoesterase TrpH
LGEIDFHLHSYYSDGLLSPSKIVQYAKESNLKAISLTDHDSFEGISEAIELGKKLKIEIIPGVELSAGMDNGEHRDIHLLAYFIDPATLQESGGKELEKNLEHFREERIKRAEKIVKNLKQLGLNISFEDVMNKAGKGIVGRPHIADVLAEKGYCSYEEAFQNYLNYTSQVYEDKYRISAIDAIKLVHKAGGMVFLAHPANYVKNNIVLELVRNKLDGIETLHPSHTSDMISYYKNIVSQNKLLEIGGSDCHARNGNVAIGRLSIPYEFLEKMVKFKNKEKR